MVKKMPEYLLNVTPRVAAGLVAGTLGGAVGGAVLSLVLMIVTDEGLTAHSALFAALIGGAIGAPIGVITGMLKVVICRGTAAKVAWIVVSGLGSGLGARLCLGARSYDEYDMALLIVFTVLGAITAAATVQCLTLLFCRENGEETTTKTMTYRSMAFLLVGFLLVAPAVYAILELLVSVTD